MLSYRHAFHAGNHADVLKHLVLAACLDYLARKPTPYLYVDTHAGPGEFDLLSGYAAANREWVDGAAKLEAAAVGTPPPEAVTAYLRAVSEFRSWAGKNAYPGSPRLALERLRPQDRARLFELHTSDFPVLLAGCAADQRCRAERRDGLAALASLLPPPSRRACVLIDPSYEVKTDYAAVEAALAGALRRFAGGLYLVWYPLLERPEAISLPERLLALHSGNRCRAELRVRPPSPDGRGLSGSGMVVLNPPYLLRAALDAALPYLAETLGMAGHGGWTLDWREADARPGATAPNAAGSNAAIT